MPHSEFWPFVKVAENIDNSDASSALQKQLGDMEGEVKEIQMELAAIKRGRLDLYANKQINIFTPAKQHELSEASIESSPRNSLEDRCIASDEICKLREELTKAKHFAEEERLQRLKYEEKFKCLENKLNSIICGPETNFELKEHKKNSDEAVTTLKTRVRNMKDETEELKIAVTEKNEQLQEYRVKYLQAQQQVEELRRQLDIMELENKQVSDQIQIEIQKMKMQFQEKLQELAPLPDLLKGAQIQLQEARQLQKLAEDSSQHLSEELHVVKEKLVLAVTGLNQEKNDRIKLIDENRTIKCLLGDREKEVEELSRNVDDYKNRVLRLDEKLLQEERRYSEKANECTNLLRDLDELRQESNRSLTRSKERSDSMRRYLQTQISELERQLIQSRAQCRACQKERDEIRQRMQIQINNLQENFELVEIRVRALQNQVTSLKNSYTVILADDEDTNDYKIATL